MARSHVILPHIKKKKPRNRLIPTKRNKNAMPLPFKRQPYIVAHKIHTIIMNNYGLISSYLPKTLNWASLTYGQLEFLLARGSLKRTASWHFKLIPN